MAQNYLSYTSRDFESIKADLVNAIPNLTDIWTSREESDPGMVLITLMSALGDNLSFNMDQQSLEFYGKTFTQRKSAARVLDLIGYKLHWYKSATLEVTVYNNHPTHKLFLMFNPASSTNTQRLSSSHIATAPSYFLLNPDETAQNWDVNTNIEIPAGGSKTLTAVQGTLTSVSFDASAIDINNRYYISNTKIDQNHLWLKDSANFKWYQVDNINNLTETAPRFEFGVDEYNLPYIELVPYWRSLYGEIHTFTLYYLITRGSSGNVAANVLNQITSISNYSPNATRGIKPKDVLVVHGANTTPNTNTLNQPGADPQTAKEAYYDSRNYIGVYNTLVTLQDFEKYMLRLNLISAAKAVDGQYAKEYNALIPDEEAYNRIYPINYADNTFILTDSVSTYPVIPYTGTDVSTVDKVEATLVYENTDPNIPDTWFKGDLHTYTSEKLTAIDELGAVSMGSLKFKHNGTVGDIKAGILPAEDHSAGTKLVHFLIHFENIPTDTSKIKNLKLVLEEPGYESHATDLLPAVFEDKKIPTSNYYKELFEHYTDKSSDFSHKFMSCNIEVETYSSGKYYLKCIYELDDSAKDLEPISIYLDQIEIKDKNTPDAKDILNGLGEFCVGSVKAELHTTTINNSEFIFNLTEPTEQNSNYIIHEYYNRSTMEWTTVDSDIIVLPISRIDGTGIENKTFYFRKASPDFKPYNLQMHMVAGDFLIASPTQSTYAYATETPITVETTEDGKPQGYISYQLGDAIVGADEDSLLSQTDFDSVRLFNTEISYGPVRKFPFFIDGQIHLKAPVRPAEANLILSRVYAALQTYFNTYNLTMGEKITFNNVIAVIRSADERIDYFDAGANNEHGSLFIYPTTADYNPNDYDPFTEVYGKYGVNINPKYFNELSLQHYEDLLQANNSIIYWGDTMSRHLSIAADSISEKSTPLTAGISAILSYDKNKAGVITPDPDVVNLYEYNIIKNAVVDTEHKLVTTNIPKNVAIRKYKNFQTPKSGSANYMYYVEIPLGNTEIADETVYANSPAFRFTLNDEAGTSRLFGWNASLGSFAILDEVGATIIPEVGKSQSFTSSYFTIERTDTKLIITVTDPIVDVSTNTLVYYLAEAKPETHVDFFNSSWQESNVFNNIRGIGLSTEENVQDFSCLYETLTTTDHIWGREALEFDSYFNLKSVGCDYTTVYDKFNNGFVAAIRSKETITSKPSAEVVSNYAAWVE